MKKQRRNICSRKRTKQDHVQKQRIIKKNEFFFRKKKRERTNMQKQRNLKKCSTKK